MAYLAMETDPSIEFDFYLATKLGKHVAEIREMPHEDYVGWVVYYGRKAQRDEIAMAKAKAGR